MDSLPDILKQNREKLELTQEEIAIKLGISQGRYASYETGNRKPKMDFYLNYKSTFGIDLTENMTNDIPYSPSSNGRIIEDPEFIEVPVLSRARAGRDVKSGDISPSTLDRLPKMP